LREWRKLHSSLIESARLASLSDSAAILFCLLVAAQDDTGWYPWEPTKIRRLTLARPWSIDQTLEYARELVNAGMASFEEGGILLRKGKDLNGRPRKDVAALLYSRDVNVTSTPRYESVSLEKSRVEKSRVEKSRVEIPNPPTKQSKGSSWTPPEFYKPLTLLSGYKKINHSQHAKMISNICDEAGVDAGLVVSQFASQYDILKYKYGWSDPSAALQTRSLAIAISDVKKGGGKTNTGQTNGSKTRNPDAYLEEYIRRRGKLPSA
jgi:hypothetical protein